MPTLTFKQRLFVAAYLGESNGNATDAAIRAGYGSNRHSAHTIGGRLLRKVAVRSAIEARLAKVAMSQDEVLARISDLASANLDDFLDIDENGHRANLLKGKRRGRLHTLKKIKVKVRTFIAKGDDEPTTEVETEIELHDPQAALEKLARFHGLDARTAIQAEQHRELKARVEALEKADDESVSPRPAARAVPPTPDGGST